MGQREVLTVHAFSVLSCYKQVAPKLSGALMTVVMPCTCLALSESGLPVCA